MGKYQDNEERLADEMHRYKVEAEKFKDKMEKAQAEVDVLMVERNKHDQVHMYKTCVTYDIFAQNFF
jgi:uncharacterized membrane protein (DUF106 family)